MSGSDETGTAGARALVVGVAAGMPLMAAFAAAVEGGPLGVVAAAGSSAAVVLGVTVVRWFDADEAAGAVAEAAESGDGPAAVLREVA